MSYEIDKNALFNRHFDVALVHSYAVTQADHELVPNLMGKLQVKAAGAILEKGVVDNLVFTCAPYVSSQKESTATIMRNYFELTFPSLGKSTKAEGRIYSLERPKSTSEELREFKLLTDVKNWKECLVIADYYHIKRVRKLLRLYDITNVDTISAKEVLTNPRVGKEADRYKELYEVFESSLPQIKYRIREIILDLATVNKTVDSFIVRLAHSPIRI